MVLIDHHVHGVLRADLDRPRFEALLTESSFPPPAGTTAFDSQLGFAVRRWCAPVLDLEPHAPADDYLRRRAELGSAEVSRRLLTAAAVTAWLVDTGYHSDDVTTPGELAAISGSPALQIARLESMAEQVARSADSAARFGEAVTAAIVTAASQPGTAGFKSVAAYRCGLDFQPTRPRESEVEAAAGRWLRTVDARQPARLEDQMLIRHCIWAALDTGLPLQLHTGYGDADSRLHRADPALLQDFLAASQHTGAAVMLLHCYPYHRQAGAMASLFPHVYLDVGEALNHVGARSPAILAEALELTPFHKMLYSSDAFGLPELHYLGAAEFRRDIAAVTGAFVADGAWTAADAARVAEVIGSGNARRVYRLS
ncbi:MAG: amidohydrolase family protein [Actinobacteria bacterium]|nr:amidohydrolase family protein [Actinomycetota bacterium]